MILKNKQWRQKGSKIIAIQRYYMVRKTKKVNWWTVRSNLLGCSFTNEVYEVFSALKTSSSSPPEVLYIWCSLWTDQFLTILSSLLTTHTHLVKLTQPSNLWLSNTSESFEFSKLAPLYSHQFRFCFSHIALTYNPMWHGFCYSLSLPSENRDCQFSSPFHI